jgi:hypothetical protein
MAAIHFAPSEQDQLKLICRASTDKTVMMKRDASSLLKSMARLSLNNRLSLKEAFERLSRQASISEQERHVHGNKMSSYSMGVSDGPEEFQSFEYQALLLCFKQGERCRQTPEDLLQCQNQNQVQNQLSQPSSATTLSGSTCTPTALPPLFDATPATPVQTKNSNVTNISSFAPTDLSFPITSSQLLEASSLPSQTNGSSAAFSGAVSLSDSIPALAFFSTSETQQQQQSGSTVSTRPTNEAESAGPYFLRNTRRKLEISTSAPSTASSNMTPTHGSRPLPATPLAVTSAAVPAVTMASLPRSTRSESYSVSYTSDGQQMPTQSSSPRTSTVFSFDTVNHSHSQFAPQTSAGSTVNTNNGSTESKLDAWRSDIKRRFEEVTSTGLRSNQADEYSSPYLNLPSTAPRDLALQAVPALTLKRPVEYGSTGSDCGFSVYSASSVHGINHNTATSSWKEGDLSAPSSWLQSGPRVVRDLFSNQPGQFPTNNLAQMQMQAQNQTRVQAVPDALDLTAKDWYTYPTFQLPPAYLQRPSNVVQSPLPPGPPVSAREPSYYPSMWLAERPVSSPMNDLDMDSASASAPNLNSGSSTNSNLISGFQTQGGAFPAQTTVNQALNAFRMWPTHPHPQAGFNPQLNGGGLVGLHSRNAFEPQLDFALS